MKRLLPIMLLGLLLGGCDTYRSAVTETVSAPPPVAAVTRVPLKFRLVADQNIRNLAITQSGGINYDVKFGAALISALERELAPQFESVTTVETAIADRDPRTVFGVLSFQAEPIYGRSRMLDYKININLRNAALTTRLGDYSYSGRESYEIADNTGRAILAGASFGILIPALLAEDSKDHAVAIQGALEKVIATSVKEIRDALSSDANLRQFAQSGSPPRPVSKTATPPPPQAAWQPPAVAPPPPLPQAPRFAAQPVVSRFPRGSERPDDVAVIIGNADYGRLGKDIPNVKPAHADAEGARLYATQALGIKEGNLIFMKDATSAQMTRVFGSKDNHQGQLFDWVKPGRSRVYVYYSGHGAPGGQGGSPYLIPTDADAARIELNGYPLKQLYDNLGKLPADSVTVVLEACFSGISPAGSVLGKASPVFFEVKAPPVPANLTVIAAGAANQMASWESDESSGLFTKYYLKGMAGEADADKDGRVTLDELDRYLKGTLTYFARRHYGRDQNAQIVKGGGR